MSLTLNESVRDIVRRGIDRAYISALPTSPLNDPAVIRDILKDTVSVSSFLRHQSLRTSYRIAVVI